MFDRRIILGGLPRSGSTLLRFMLDASPDVLSGPETGLFLDPLSQHQARIETVAPRVAEKLGIAEDVVRKAIGESRTLFEAYDRLMQELARLAGVSKSAWAEKTPRNCYNYHFLAAEDPQAYFVTTIRHGLDVVTSMVESRRANEYWVSIQRYCDTMRAIYAFESHPRHLIVRYEDLVSDPEATALRVMGFLGLAYDPAMIENFNSQTLTRDLSKVNQPKLREPIQASWVGRWSAAEHAARVQEFRDNLDAVAWLRRSGY